MRLTTTSILAALIATSQAYIQAISVPKIIKPGDTVNLKLISATNMMTVDDIAVAFGYATGNGYAGALGTNLGSFYLGPSTLLSSNHCRDNQYLTSSRRIQLRVNCYNQDRDFPFRHS